MEEEVKAPPEQVWALISDAKRFPEWIEFTDRIVEAPEGEMQVDTTWREYGGVPLFKSEM
jgi:uncharacterized protein YndB with AHSA1/START domain